MTDRLSRRAGDFAAGVALLVFPFVTAIVKLIAPGWMALFYLTGLIVFVPLYVLVVVIVITGFFARRSPFAFVAGGRVRARIAAGRTSARSCARRPCSSTAGMTAPGPRPSR